jgi:hypothetical protein
MRNRLFSTVTIVSVVGSSVFFGGLTARADWRADIGYTELAAELGSNIPTGLGVRVSQVEAQETTNGAPNGNYRPDPSNASFTGKTFNWRTASPSGISSHATTVGQYLYGASGVAKGATNIDSWEANSWINSSLRVESSSAPITETCKVQNHSWIGTFTAADDPGHAIATDITRRLDYAIQRDNYVAVVGVNNGSSTSLPDILCQSYNAISVGLTNGAGRTKPDIVAPSTATSYATPMVAGAAALTIQTAASMGYADAQNSVAAKSILLAGATKDEFPTWSHTHTNPLDTTFGAGELNVDRNYHILAGGEQKPSLSQLVTGPGWDYNKSLASGSERLYFFDVPTNTTLGELSVVLTWNRIVGHSGNWATTTSTLANLDLDLWSATGFTPLSKLDYSNSAVDNVEHIYSQNLAAGRYALGVSSDTANINYGLAWYAGDVLAVPEPGALVMLATCLVLFGLYFHRGRIAVKSPG